MPFSGDGWRPGYEGGARPLLATRLGSRPDDGIDEDAECDALLEAAARDEDSGLGNVD
jgi:hypothetical protein